MTPCQEPAAGEGGEGGYRHQPKRTHHRVDDFGGDVLVIENVDHRRALSHEDHEKSHVAPGVGQQEGGGHGAHGGPAHIHAGAHRLTPADVGALLHHLVYRRADVHRQIHHRAGGADKDGGHKDAGQVQVLIAAVEQALRIGHHRAVDLKEVGEEHPQHAGDQNAQKRPRDGCQGPAVEAVDQGDDQHRQPQGDGQTGEDGVMSPEIDRHQHLPKHQHREDEGGNGPDAGLPGEEDEEDREEQGQEPLRAHAVVVDHSDVLHRIPPEADHHQGFVARGEELVQLQGAVQEVYALDRPALEAAAQQLQRTKLLAGADQAGIDDGGIVGGDYPGGDPVRPLVDRRVLKPGGEEEQHGDEQQADRRGGVVAEPGGIMEKLHGLVAPSGKSVVGSAGQGRGVKWVSTPNPAQRMRPFGRILCAGMPWEGRETPIRRRPGERPSWRKSGCCRRSPQRAPRRRLVRRRPRAGRCGRRRRS